MCDNLATSNEHVPPKCIFPPNLRANLITVPSCDKHNLDKSHDDEYLRDILCMYGLEKGDNVHQEVCLDKLERADKKNPHRLSYFMNNVNTVDGKLVYKVNKKKLKNIFYHIAMGIFFHHYKKQWPGECEVTLLFLHTDKQMKNEMLSIFNNFEEYGNNKAIFKYIITPIDYFFCVIKMTFFREIEVIVRSKS